MAENGMADIERRVELGLLMDFYGNMLSERIAGIMRKYVNEDYGLSEIACEMGISRQGVYDAVRRGESQLTEFESRMGLIKRQRAMAEAARRCEEKLRLVKPCAGSEAALAQALSILSDMRGI